MTRSASSIALLRASSLAVALSLAVVTLAAGPVRAQESGGGSAAAWNRFPALRLFVNDEADSAGGVFWSAGRFLAVPGQGDSVYVVVPVELAVHRVARAGLPIIGGAPAPDPGRLSEKTRIAALEKDGSVMRWRDGHVAFALSAKPPLLGVVTIDAILEHKPQYREDAAAYNPDPASVSRLRDLDRPLELVVGFGTWCSNCAEWLPRFLRVMGDAKNNRLQATYVSVSEDLKRPAAELAAFGIDGVPTFIVRRDGREIGRVDLDALEAEATPVLEKMLVAIIDRDS